MKNLRILFAAAVTLIPTVAFASNDDREPTIDGRSHQTIISILQNNGIDANSVEDWGGAIRVDAQTANGANSYVLVDKITLKVRQPASGVATQLSVRPTGAGWATEAFSSPDSLVEND